MFFYLISEKSIPVVLKEIPHLKKVAVFVDHLSYLIGVNIEERRLEGKMTDLLEHLAARNQGTDR